MFWTPPTPSLLQAFTWKLAKSHQKNKELEMLISDSTLGKRFNQILSLIDLDKNVTTQNIKGS